MWQSSVRTNLQKVTEVANDLPHAGDGSFLHLLINVRSLQPDKCAIVELAGPRSEVEVAWDVCRHKLKRSFIIKITKEKKN